MPKPKVLVVEDDRSISEVLDYNLQQAGYEVFLSSDGQDAINQAALRLPDLVILDVMLPVIDGIEVCRRLRASKDTAKCLILMLTAKGEESDQLIGFSMGADDYVVKPFSIKVLLERIKALRRRRDIKATNQDDVVNYKGIVLDRVRHRVTSEGHPLDLTPSEFRLLETLIRQPGRAFDRAELIDAALGEDILVMERTIDVHVRALRRKLGDQGKLVETVRGVGYRLSEL